jgi:serine/threonine-protein kinase
MVMEHLTGVDFSELRKEKGSFGVSEAVGYLLEACEAIAEAHELGIVHRDLKPGNLFLHTRKRDGRRVVKVLDFGISKVDTPGEQDTTKTGQMMGSPKYMSPEQMTSMRDVDGRTDIWSLGAILFEFLCGRPPFVADNTPRVCALVLNADPPLPHTLRPDLPSDLEMVLLRCLEKDADRRFPDVKALVDALLPFAPPPELLTTGARSMVGPATPLPPSTRLVGATATPTPASTHAATVAAWDTTKYDGPNRKAPRSRRLVAGAAVLLAGVAIGVYALRGGGPVPGAPAASAVAALPSAAPSPSATEAASAAPQKPGVSPNDLPDLAPTAAPFHPAPASSASAATKKGKPPADPFGGRRN